MNNKMFRKILASFAAVVSIYTVAVLSTVVNKEFERQNLAHKNNAELMLEREASNIDLQFIDAINTMKDLSNDRRVNLLAEQNFTSTYSIYSDIYDAISEDYYSTHRMQYNVGITNGFGEPVISSDGYFDFNEYINFIQLGQNVQFLKNYFDSTDQAEITLLSGTHKTTLIREVKYSVHQSIFYFITWKSTDLFSSEMLEQKAELEIVDTVHHRLENQEEGPLNSPIQSLINEEPSSSAGQKEASDKLIEFERQSTVLPSLVYLYTETMPRNELPLSTIESIVKYLFLLMGVGLVIVYVLSKKNYQPYQQIIEKLDSGKQELIDYKEINDVLKSLQDMVDKNISMNQFKTTMSNEIRETFFKNLLIGKYSNQESSELLQALEIPDFSQGGLVALINFDGISKKESLLSENDRIMARKQILATISEESSRDEVVTITMSAQRFALVFANKNSAEISGIVHKIMQRVRQEIQVTSSYVLSVPFYSIHQFSRVFRDVNHSLDDPYMFDVAEELHDKSDVFKYSVEMEQEIISAVRAQEFERARDKFNQVVNQNLSAESVDLITIKDTKTSLLQTMKRIFQNENLLFEDFLKANDQLLSRLYTSTDPEEVSKLLVKLMVLVITQVEEVKQNNQSLIDKIVAFIGTRYTEDLSLSEVAEHFRLSESYLSRLIKEELGISFKNYLNGLRVNKAKELLKTGKYKVHEVAELVGCNNVNTFIRVFKQAEGITPGKFIQQ